jgi:hypothetical protein
MTEFSRDDLIFYSEDGQIKSGGYSLKSALLQQNISPMMTLNVTSGIFNEQENEDLDVDENKVGGKPVSTPFENLAVPVGVFYLTQKFPKQDQQIHYKEHTSISDELYDKLFHLASYDKNKHKAKPKHQTQRKTKKIKSKQMMRKSKKIIK